MSFCANPKPWTLNPGPFCYEMPRMRQREFFRQRPGWRVRNLRVRAQGRQNRLQPGGRRIRQPGSKKWHRSLLRKMLLARQISGIEKPLDKKFNNTPNNANRRRRCQKHSMPGTPAAIFFTDTLCSVGNQISRRKISRLSPWRFSFFLHYIMLFQLCVLNPCGGEILHQTVK